jgi:hypothetical protein
MSAPGKNSDIFTRGFNNVAPQKSAVTTELKGPSVNRWGKEGYREDVKPVHQNIVPPKVNTVSSVSSTSVSNTNITSSGKVDPYMQVSGPKFDPKNQSKDIFNNINNINSQPKRPEPVVYDPKKEEKNQLMKNLFGGVGAKTPTAPKEQPQKKSSTFTTSSEQPIKKPIGNSSQTDTSKHSEDIMGMFTSNVPQTQTQPPTQNTINLIDELFGGSSIQTSKPVTQPEITTPTNNLFSFNTTQQTTPKPEVSPYKTDTDSFGELWTSCPFDEKPFDIPTKTITSPEKYFDQISKLNFFPVQIINNEAIASAKFKNKICLLHAIINTNGLINLQVKSYEDQYTNDIADYLKTVLK